MPAAAGYEKRLVDRAIGKRPDRTNEIDSQLMYAPPWARRHEQPPVTSTLPAPQVGGRELSGDRALTPLRRHLALQAQQVPAPSIEILSGSPAKETPSLIPMLFRFGAAGGVAALVAWVAVTLHSGTRQTAVMDATVGASTPLSTANGGKEQARIGFASGSSIPHKASAPSQQIQSDPVPVFAAQPSPSKSLSRDQSGAGRTAAASAQAAAGTAPTGPTEVHLERADPPPVMLDAAEIARLIDRGQEFIRNGDLTSARLLLRRAAEAGSATAALTLGTTFDPLVIQRLGAIGVVPDITLARQWYEKASKLGSSAAAQHLANLAKTRQ